MNNYRASQLNRCKVCRNKPKIADVGGYIACIEICCTKCNRAVYGRTKAEAIGIWNDINEEVKK